MIEQIDDSHEIPKSPQRSSSQYFDGPDKKIDERSSTHEILNLNIFRELEAEIQQAELNVPRLVQNQ